MKTFATIASLFFVIGCWGNSVVTKELPLLIKERVVLPPGKYHVTQNVLIKESGSLVCQPGVSLSMSPGTIITVLGEVDFQGEAGNVIEVTTEGEEPLGEGFVISGRSMHSIRFEFVHFHHLKNVLDFTDGWYRKQVDIQHCQISEVVALEPCMSVTTPDNLEFQDPIPFTFSNNIFTDNKASIAFNNVQNHHLQLRFENNLFTNNRGYGARPEGAFTAPVYFESIHHGQGYKPVVQNNAFFNNFLADSEHDTIIQELNFALGGSADLALPNNYFGTGTENQVLQKIDHYIINRNAPFLDIEPYLESIPEALSGAYVKSIMLGGEEVPDPNEMAFSDQDSLELGIEASDALEQNDEIKQIHYYAYDEGSDVLNKHELKADVRWISPSHFVLVLPNPVKLVKDLVYMSISGIKSKSGFALPTIDLGRNRFSRAVAKIRDAKRKKQAGKQAGDVTLSNEQAERIIKMLDSISVMQFNNEEDIKQMRAESLPAKYLQNTFSVGVFGGSSYYFGDLTGDNFITSSDLNWAVGLRGAYNLSPRWTPKVNFYYGKVNGSDLDDGGAHFKRGYQFRSVILEGSILMEFNLNRLGANSNYRWTPALAVGIGRFYYNPKWDYEENGETYTFNLRELGTNGQYAGRTNTLGRDAIGGYGLTSWCIPLEFSLKRIAGKRNQWLASFMIGWRYTFTDHLDDVGGYEYASYAEMTSQGQREQYQIVADRMGVSPDLVERAALDFWQPNDLSTSGTRGNAAIKDWYFYTGITISRILPYVRKE